MRKIILFAILAFITNGAALANDKCMVSKHGHVMLDKYNDQEAYELLLKIDKEVAVVFLKSTPCKKFNNALAAQKNNEAVAQLLYCNSGYNGYEDGAYNCAINLINKNEDKLKGLQILSRLKEQGHLMSGYILLKEKLKNKLRDDNYVPNAAVMTELEKYSKSIPEAAVIKIILDCKILGEKKLSECIKKERNLND